MFVDRGVTRVNVLLPSCACLPSARWRSWSVYRPWTWRQSRAADRMKRGLGRSTGTESPTPT